MIKLLFSNRSPKYIFKFSKSINFFEREVKDVDELVNLIEDENYRLLREAETASVVVTKMKVKSNEVLFRQQFNLPKRGKVDWVRECEGFYTKTPIAFEPIELEENQHIEQEKLDEKETPEANSIEMTQAEVKQEEAHFCTDCGKPLPQFVAFCQFCGAAQHVEPQTPLSETSDSDNQNETIKSVNPKLDDENVDLFDEAQKVSTEEKSPSRDWSSDVVSEEEMDNEPQKTPTNVETFELDVASDEIIGDLLNAFKANADQVLKNFVEKENTKIQAELKELDKRSEISERVTQKYRFEEASAKRVAETQVVEERQAAVDAENQRHQEALAQIEQEAETKKLSELKRLSSLYQNKTQSEIEAKTQRETAQLAEILNGKTAELALRKQELNKGLKNRFEQTLNNFNQNQSEMIERLNELSKLKKPIDLTKHQRRTIA